MTLIGASIVLHTTRKDIYGTKHNSSDYIDFQIEVANPRHVEQGRNHGQNPQQMQQELYAQPSTQRRPIQQLSPVINTPQSQYYPEQQQQYALGTSYDGFGSTPPRTSARNSPYIGGHSAVSLQLVSQQDFSELSAPPPRNGGEPAT